jgi:hypothetical protein
MAASRDADIIKAAEAANAMEFIDTIATMA